MKNYDVFAVIVIQLETDIGDILHVPDFVAVEVGQELDQFFSGQLLLGICECDKSEDEGVLLSDLVDEDDFASCLSEFNVNQ